MANLIKKKKKKKEVECVLKRKLLDLQWLVLKVAVQGLFCNYKSLCRMNLSVGYWWELEQESSAHIPGTPA